jgi:hypothetical protein
MAGFQGPADHLTGDAPNEKVREEAKVNLDFLL